MAKKEIEKEEHKAKGGKVVKLKEHGVAMKKGGHVKEEKGAKHVHVHIHHHNAGK